MHLPRSTGRRFVKLSGHCELIGRRSFEKVRVVVTGFRLGGSFFGVGFFEVIVKVFEVIVQQKSF